VRILRAPSAGPHRAVVTMHYGAARLELMSVLFHQEALFAVAFVYSTPPLQGIRVRAAAPPVAFPPQTYPVMAMPPETAPPVTGRFEYRPVPAVGTDASGTADLVWVRHRQPHGGG
jgi:hypothetical protein